MKFKELVDDIVYFEATALDKLALLKFIDASIGDIDVHRVEMSSMGASRTELEEMRQVISGHTNAQKPIAMRHNLFVGMRSAANAWKTFGFDLAQPEEYDKIGADVETVDALLKMYSDSLKET